MDAGYPVFPERPIGIKQFRQDLIWFLKSDIMKQLLLLLLLLNGNFILSQEYSQLQIDSLRAEIKMASETDYQYLLGQLGITSVRPGVNGSDPKAANPVNYDESKASPYPDYPDPLIGIDGRKVTAAVDWETWRRPEIVDAFDSEVFGRMPENIPTVNWEVVSENNEMEGQIPVIRKALIGNVDNSRYNQISVAIEASLTLPAKAVTPSPVIIQLIFTSPPGYPKRDPKPAELAWKTQLLEAGWGYAELKPTSIQPDNGAGLTEGIIGLTNLGNRRSPGQWGALKAWAWGAGRLLDYFVSDPQVDQNKVGISGHSRYGKAALVAMAYDPRFAIAFISSSGAGGASLLRRNYGEVLENVAAASEYHWMAGTFINYAGPLQWNDLPVDAHELIALCAPRPVFIGSGADGDQWADPRGMFLATEKASAVYQLYGLEGLGANEFPTPETDLIKGSLGFRQHSEGHTPAPNWPAFIRFASKFIE